MSELKLYVVREEITSPKLARLIYDRLQSEPHEHTIGFLASKFGVAEDQVAHVLHNYGPDGNGGVERRPEGQGGGWLPESVAEQHRSALEDPEEVGYRWPDGQLRDSPFDLGDPEHRALVGWPDPPATAEDEA